MNDAEAILRRLYAALMKSAASGTSMTEDDAIRESADEPELFAALVDARAYLSRPKPVMAEGWAAFDGSDGLWFVTVEAYHIDLPEDAYKVRVRIPVPAHLLEPPTVTGEVVEEG